MVAVLIDPDKASENQIDKLVFNPSFDQVDFIFVGGSTFVVAEIPFL